MGGSNWLNDDSAVNRECHVIKWIRTDAVYYAWVEVLTCWRYAKCVEGRETGSWLCTYLGVLL